MVLGTVQGEAVLKKLEEMDVLRGFAATWVYLSHVAFLAGLKDARGLIGIVTHGGNAVTVFIMISGFAIASSLLHSKANYGEYMARRASRIYPVYLIALILGIATSALYPPLLHDLPWVAQDDIARIDARTALETTQFWPLLTSHLVMMHGVIPDPLLYGASLTFNSPLWSLSLEWQFYLLAPVILAALMNPRRHWWGVLLLLAICVVGPGYFKPYFAQVPSFLPMRLTYFVIGILTALHMGTLVGHKWIVLLGGAVGGLAYAKLVGLAEALPFLLWWGCVSLSFDWGNGGVALARRLFTWKPLVAFGERSYGFYAFHMPVLMLWAILLESQGLLTSEWMTAALLLPPFFIAAGLAWASYDLMEVRINRWAKERFRGSRTVPATRIVPTRGDVLEGTS